MFCYTQNYTWCTSKVLGHGATAGVYEGVHRVTEQKVALKVFRTELKQFLKFPNQEQEILRGIDHKNIVKLLAIEHETVGPRDSRIKNNLPVLVMELCDRRCLQDALMDPENMFGMPDEVVLRVLKHLTAAYRYLREKKLVHRDLKPGNILIFTKKNGKSVYKLGDFGAARELQDEERYESLCGTPEYLYPKLYGAAILNHSYTSGFKATTDLWSIGVTLYHLATGQIPFKPFGSVRQNRDIMHHIISGKEPGVISGVQEREDGPIKWSKSLPETSILSRSTKAILTPLLAQLLDKGATYDQFFKLSDEILAKRAAWIFYVNGARVARIMCEGPNEDFREQVREEFGIGLEDQQMLAYHKGNFVRSLDDFGTDTPVVNLRTQSPVVTYVSTEGSCEEIQAILRGLSNREIVQNFALGYHYKREIENLCQGSTFLFNFIDDFTLFVKNQQAELLNKSRVLAEKLSVYTDLSPLFPTATSSIHKVQDRLNALLDEAEISRRQGILWDNLPTDKRVTKKQVLKSEPLLKSLVQSLGDLYSDCLNSADFAKFQRVATKRLNALLVELKGLTKQTHLMYERLVKCFEEWYKMWVDVYASGESVGAALDEVNFQEIKERLHGSGGVRFTSSKNVLSLLSDHLEDKVDASKLIADHDEILNKMNNLDWNLDIL